MALTRRDLLRLTGAGAGILVVGGVAGTVLTACSPSGANSGQPVEGGGDGTPKRGGTVRLAFTGSGATESLDPFAVYGPAELARSLVVFDRLFTVVDGVVTSALAERVEPAADARSFVLTLRDGVTWHDGSPLTAVDLAYTFTYLAAPDRPYPSELSAYLDIPNITVTGDLTVRVPTLRPVGDPAAMFAGSTMAVIKDGTTSFAAADVVGTGPYRVAAFEPGREARLTRYDQHWDGAPYADELVILSVDDPQARVNAVQGGQADYAADIPYPIARTGAGSAELEIRAAGERHRNGYGFVLNTTRPLMADPKVRKALRLAVDRQALVDSVFLGYGVPANDLYGYGAQYFADGVPMLERDVKPARALLTEAGAIGAPLVIRSADYEVGLNSATELYVEQLRELGMDAQAQLVGVAEYFDLEAIGTVDALAFPLGPHPLGVIFNRSAAYPSLAFDDPELATALATATSTTDEAEREQAWLTAQRVMADRGNWVVWGRGDVLSLTRKDVAGVEVRESAKYPYLGKVGFLA